MPAAIISSISDGPSSAAAAAGLTLDPLLVPRLQAYAESNKTLLRDVDGAVEHLCRSFREYKRKPKGVFRKTVERAIGVVLAKEGKNNKSEEKINTNSIDLKDLINNFNSDDNDNDNDNDM